MSFAPQLPTAEEVRQRDHQLVLAGPYLPAKLPDDLRASVERRAVAVVERAEAAGAPITYIGIGQTLETPRLYPGATTDWVLMRVADDPLAKTGPFPIPREQRKHLVRLLNAGVEMQDLLVAHEVPSSDVQSALPAIPRRGPLELPLELAASLIEHPGPAASTRRFTSLTADASERAIRAAKRAGRETAQAAKYTAIGAGAVVGAAALAPFALAAALLDPVIFGVRSVPCFPDAMVVFELARWEW